MVFLPYCCCRLFTTLLLLALCEADGECTRPENVKNAQLNSRKMKEIYPIGSTLTYNCLKGYEYIPGVVPEIMCSASEWIPNSPRFCQGKKCPSPDIENGRIITSTEMRLGDRITFACDDGYRLEGHNTSRCSLIADKVKWDHLPTCKRITCASPPDISNGRKIGAHKPFYSYGSEITYMCDHGYSLIGSETISCIAAENAVDGEWDSPLPQCKGIHCPKPEIEHGSTGSLHPSFSRGESLNIKCNTDYILSGSSHIKCGEDNHWHPPVPKCVLDSTVTATAASFSTQPATPSVHDFQLEQTEYFGRSMKDRLNDLEEKVDKILRKVSKSCTENAKGERAVI